MKEVNVKRKLRVDRLITAIFLLTMLAFFASSTLLKSYNVSLSAQNVRMEDQIVQLKAEIATISIDIENLSEYNRVITTLSSGNTKNLNSNVTNITN